MLPQLNLPLANLKISQQAGKYYVWCEIRRKKLVLTPEEWVRQHLIHYLIYHKQYPKGRIASEVEISVNQVKRRCDLVVYNEFLEPQLLIECKAPHINLDVKVVQQIIQYNNHLKVPIIAISNGITHEIIRIDYQTNTFEKLGDFV